MIIGSNNGSGCRPGHPDNKKLNFQVTRHKELGVVDPGLDLYQLLPGLRFTSTKQPSKSVGKSREQADLQHERHPRKRNHYHREVASLAMAA